MDQITSDAEIEGKDLCVIMSWGVGIMSIALCSKNDAEAWQSLVMLCSFGI